MSENMRQIGKRIREIREICEFTQQQMAHKLDIAPEVYAEYEDSGADIPISVLYEMAKIFNIDLTDLLTGISPRLHNFSFVKAGEGVKVERYKGYNFQSLSYSFKGKKSEPLLVTVEPEENKKMCLVTHPGQEFNYVLEGRIKVILGEREVVMETGDSLYFNPEIPHGQVALDNQTAKFLTVILHDT